MALKGRPSSYKPEYCQQIIEHVGVEGNTIRSFATFIRVHKDTLYEWATVHPDFSAALKQAQHDSEAYWELWLKDNLDNKNANAPLVKLYFANRFGWHDKQEIKQDIQIRKNFIFQHEKKKW